MATNANRWNLYWKQMPILGPCGIIGITIGVAIVLVFALIVIFFLVEEEEPNRTGRTRGAFS